jgi:hypothetical protein
MVHTEDNGTETYDGADVDLPVSDKEAGNPDFGGVIVFPITLTVGGGKGQVFELFEGWNLINNGDWPGPALAGDDITAFFNANLEGDWEALAVFNTDTDQWEQRFFDAPLPSFNTLTEVEPGDDLWIFVPGDATLTIPE